MESNYIPVIPFDQKPWLDRLCTQCKWCEPTDTKYLFMCSAPRQGRNMVTGEQRKSSCAWHRNMSPVTPNCCTGKGLWWEPKPDPS